MSKRFTLETTYEQADASGTVNASIEVRICFEYVPGMPAYFDYAVGVGEPAVPAKVEFVFAKVESAPGVWVPAPDWLGIWSAEFTSDRPDIFLDFVKRETESWHD